MRRALAGLLLLLPAAVAAQSSVVTITDLRPRELRSTVFRVTAAQDLRVTAVGAEPEGRRGTFGWVTTMWASSTDAATEPWLGNAWILDLTTRRVVWELSAAPTTRGHRDTATFNGAVHLLPGTYEAFYAAYPSISVDDSSHTTAARFINWLHDSGVDLFRLTIDGNAQTVTGAEADRARHAFEADAVVALHGSPKEPFLQAGFALDRPTTVEWYAEGELRENAEFDTGWIVNADTHELVWKLTWRTSAPAGGAPKNRFARISRTLPAGRYAALYTSDDSHAPGDWNQAPPHDPEAWGLVVRVVDPAARAGVKTFAYQHVAEDAVIVALTRIGNAESRTRAFTVPRPMDVRVYAIGEGRNDQMFDYGWITNAATNQRVWEMRYADSGHAGGDPKNRVVDQTIHLDKGEYIVHYVSDDSHAYDDWNASPPYDPRHWGITILAARAGGVP